MSTKKEFKLSKEYLIPKGKGFGDRLSVVLEKTVVDPAEKVLLIESLSEDRLYLYPIPAGKVVVIIRMETVSTMKKIMDEALVVLRVNLGYLGFFGLFDGGICADQPDSCRWKGYFWVGTEQITKLSELEKKMRPHKLSYEIVK